MAKYITLFVTGCWCALMSFAYGRAEQWRPHAPVHTVSARQVAEPVRLWSEGYDNAEIARLDQVVARKPTQSERAAALRERQAKVLAEVYGITPGNADSFREWW